MPDGDYHGRPARRLCSRYLWLDVLTAAGPRIVRIGLAGSARNLLAETPDAGWETSLGRYDLLGGHRLWFAPEDPERVAVPDSAGLVVRDEPWGLRLLGEAEPSTGLVRSISVHLDPSAPAVDLRHEIRNVGDRAVRLAPWAITQLPLGGLALVPQPAAITDHAVRPNRTLVLWPYTSWEDPRLSLRDGLIVVAADPGPDLKVGTFDPVGCVGYLRDGVLLVRRFRPSLHGLHPDRGCNVETYCGDRFLELELVGPLRRLAPGGSAVLTERWELIRVASEDAAVAALRAASRYGSVAQPWPPSSQATLTS